MTNINPITVRNAAGEIIEITKFTTPLEKIEYLWRRGVYDEVEYLAKKADAEYAALTDDQRVQYIEATRCGATHNDAMEAALTNGYRTNPRSQA